MSENLPAVVQRQQPAPVTQDAFELLTKMASSISLDLFGMRKPSDAMTLFLMARAEGVDPMISLRRHHFIDGKPTLRAEAMLADFKQAGGKVSWKERSDEAVEAVFTAPGDEPTTIRWTIDRAKKSELTGKANWKKYPCQMLTARVITEGVRLVMPQIFCGIYSTEEVQDMEPKAVTATIVQPAASLPIIPATPAVAPHQAGEIVDAEFQVVPETVAAPAPVVGSEPAAQTPDKPAGSSSSKEKKLGVRRVGMLDRLRGKLFNIGMTPEMWAGALERRGVKDIADLSNEAADEFALKLAQQLDMHYRTQIQLSEATAEAKDAALIAAGVQDPAFIENVLNLESRANRLSHQLDLLYVGMANGTNGKREMPAADGDAG